MFGRLFDPLLSLLYPVHCTLCGRGVKRHADGSACEDCWSRVTTLFGTQNAGRIGCPKCGSTDLSGPAGLDHCRICRDHHYDFARAAAIYSGALAAAIIRLKKEPVLPGRTRKWIREAASEFPSDSVVMPVPLSRQRLAERGFDQALIIAKEFARVGGTRPESGTLVRSVDVPMHRAAMDRKARLDSVRRAFEVTRPSRVAGRTIILVDDVFTSGATASECARVLKKNGAAKVLVFTLARAERSF